MSDTKNPNPAPKLPTFRCDNCDNGVELDWEFCAWCGATKNWVPMSDTTAAYVTEYFTWRDAQRKKHRVMTWTEYNGWSIVGDGISSPSNSNAMNGGLTIVLGGNVLGRIVDYEEPPIPPVEE